jgi:hypothetical protein
MELFDLLAGWARAPRADGAELSGPDGATILLRAGVAPIPTLRGAIDREVSPGAAVARLERFTTREGEPGALATGERWALALAIGDERAALAVGRGTGLDHLVRTLGEHAYLGHGEVRRRRYVYAPPPRWRGLARPHSARWLHPASPRTDHVLTVFDARPTLATEPEISDRLLISHSTHGCEVLAPRPLGAARNAGGELAGTYARIDLIDRTGPRSIIRAALHDARFHYAVELAGPTVTVGRDLPTLEALVASIEAIPYTTTTDRRESFLYWGD